MASLQACWIRCSTLYLYRSFGRFWYVKMREPPCSKQLHWKTSLKKIFTIILKCQKEPEFFEIINEIFSLRLWNEVIFRYLKFHKTLQVIFGQTFGIKMKCQICLLLASLLEKHMLHYENQLNKNNKNQSCYTNV